MKKSFVLILAAFIFCMQSIAQTAAQEAIKKVCAAETKAYKNLDYNAWASYHVQSKDEQLSWNNPDASFGFESGWNKISNGMKDWFKTAKKDGSKISRDNYTIVIHGDMAFATYNATTKNTEGKEIKMREYRTLLLIDGSWKILAVQAYADYAIDKK